MPHRLTVTLDDDHAETLARLARRLRVDPETLASGALASDLDDMERGESPEDDGDRVAALERRIEELEDRVLRLAICKVPDPRYPFFDWQVASLRSEEEHTWAQWLAVVFEERAEGTEPKAPGRWPSDRLDRRVLEPGTPTWPEIELAFEQLFDWRPHAVHEMFRAMFGQGMLEHLERTVGPPPAQ
jgi:predicted transcriptional regulator